MKKQLPGGVSIKIKSSEKDALIEELRTNLWIIKEEEVDYKAAEEDLKHCEKRYEDLLETKEKEDQDNQRLLDEDA